MMHNLISFSYISIEKDEDVFLSDLNDDAFAIKQRCFDVEDIDYTGRGSHILHNSHSSC